MIQIILISLVVAGMAGAAGLAWRRLPKRTARRCLWLMFAGYVLGNMYFTLLSRIVGSGTMVELRPFASYVRMFQKVETGFENAFGFAALFLEGTSPMAGQILNVLLYCPLGYLLSALFPKLGLRRIVLIGCAASVATEITQYLLQMGWCEIDDVLHNTLGTVLGVWLWRWQKKRMHASQDGQ